MTIQWDSRNAGMIFVVGLMLLTAIWWLWWRLPQRQVARLSLKIRNPKDRLDAEDDLRKTIGQLLGGVAVLIGGGFAYLQFLEQQRATHDQLQAAHDLLISNQTAKGFELLASDKIAMRLGGIYELEGVMNDPSQQYHQPVLEALCAFILNSTREIPINDRPAMDVQAALTVIGRRKEGPGDIHLVQAKIPKVFLFKSDLSDANLSYADLSSAVLSNAILHNTIFSHANLSGAILTGARLGGAILMDANLSGADLRGVILDGPVELNRACGVAVKGLPSGVTLQPCSIK